jgi:non-specific serine/threonine protein kinase
VKLNPERYRQIDQLLEAALERDPPDRPAFLNEACAGDDDLLRKVESLLAAHVQAASFLESPPVEAVKEVFETETIGSLVGTTLDRYKIRSLLGEGGMGKVYLAHDQKLLSKPVVIKVLSKRSNQNEWIRKKFRQEVEALARIDHPGVIGLLDAGETPVGDLYFVMQYVEGSSLRLAMKPGGMDFNRIANIVRQIGQAITAAHEKGICHRDLKPENIMLQRLGEGDELVKLIDFGIASVRDSVVAANKDTTEISGTVAYMAPEQLMGKPSASSDIYAIGVIAFEMLTGQRPFNPNTPFQLLDLQRMGVKVRIKDLRPELPESAEAIILKALSFDAEERPSRGRDFGEALARALTCDARTISALPQAHKTAILSHYSIGGTRPFAAGMSTNTGQVLEEESRRSRPHNLPVHLTSLIGRETEIAAIAKLIRQEGIRLLTLTGPGGTGKTCLALEAAATLIGDFDDGVCFISLATIFDPGLVASEVCHVLRIEEAIGSPLIDSLKQHLKSKKMLILFDNFEQLISAAPLLSELLAACPGLKMLVTSRSVLRLRAEHEFAVSPLELPDLNRLPTIDSLKECPSVALFIERAQAVRHDFALTTDNAMAVAEICARLDGLPLSIELAAARIKVLSAKEILARLDYRLTLLTGGARDLPPRQRTIRSAIAYSYDLLGESERAFFKSIAVFIGGFTLESAERLGQEAYTSELDVLESVSSLIDSSLLRREERTGGESRFRMLETIREYGLELLAKDQEVDALRHAHAGIFLDLVNRAEPELRGPEQTAWLERLEVEHDNLRAALRWSKESGQVELGLRMAALLWRFWEVRGHLSEGRMWLEELLGADQVFSASPSAQAKALYAAGVLARSQADYNQASAFFERSLALYRELCDKQGIASSLNSLGLLAHDRTDYANAMELLKEGLALYEELRDDQGIASSLEFLGIVAIHQGDYERALAFQEGGIAIRRKLGDKMGIATLLNNLGVAAQDHGDLDRATNLFEESEALFRQLGDRLGIATSLNNLGETAQYQGNYDRAASLYEESLSLFRELEDKRDIATLLNNLGSIARHKCDYSRAESLHAESLSLCSEINEKATIALCFEELGANACAQEKPERAAKLFGSAECLRESVGAPIPLARRTDYDCKVASTRATLGDEAFTLAWSKGRAMTLNEATAYALIRSANNAPAGQLE